MTSLMRPHDPPSEPFSASVRRVAVLGGGIVGLSVARTLLRHPSSPSVTLFEKESTVAAHQTGRNSGVLHSGLYYVPGSLKARLCTRGKALLEAYCDQHQLPYDRCGKVVVATREDELPHLDRLHGRADANGVPCERIDRATLREIEPHVDGIAALHVPVSGIVSYRSVCEQLAQDIRAHAHGSVELNAPVRALHQGPETVDVQIAARAPQTFDAVVNCCGLHSDRVARMAKAKPAARVVPFRGEYFELTPEAQHLVRGLVYPVPDPRFPFLGVHFTRMIEGGVECGPNAVFALAREGYRWRDVSLPDLYDALTWPGTLRLFAKHWKTGLGETWRSVSKAAFVKALQRLVPEIRAEHLVRAPAGVRAQALTREGTLVDDFEILRDGPLLHVVNAPSPAATAAFAIAEEVVERHFPSTNGTDPLHPHRRQPVRQEH